MKSLKASGVSVRFGALQALDDLTLSLEAGQALMLVGPNGAGKSTFLKVLLGLVRPDRAAFESDAGPFAIDSNWKAHIGYLPEAVAFSENLSGRQLLSFFASARGVARSEVDGVLERVGLGQAGRRSIRGYSRGMRQRLGLGVAILSTPELLILDEPTAGLDQEGLSVLWSVIAEWREAGRMVIASTHDLALMESRMDEICVLKQGRVIARGDARELRRRAGLPQCIWFDTGDADEAQVVAVCDAMERRGNGRVDRLEGRIRVEADADATLELVEAQAQFPGVVRGIRVEEPSLDAVYDKLLGVI